MMRAWRRSGALDGSTDLRERMHLAIIMLLLHVGVLRNLSPLFLVVVLPPVPPLLRIVAKLLARRCLQHGGNAAIDRVSIGIGRAYLLLDCGSRIFKGDEFA